MTRVDARALAESLNRLEEIGEDVPLIESLQQAVDASVVLFGVDGGGLMLADEQSLLRYVVSTDGPGRLLEQTQLDANSGPCVSAFVENELVTTGDVAGDERWPSLAPRIAGTGVVAVLGVPTRLGGICVGSLNVYRSRVHEWDESEQRALARYGDVVSTMMATAVRAHQAGELADQLGYALEYRVLIERGIGYLMARDKVAPVSAFGRLRSAARNDRRKIGDVADELMRTGLLPGER